MHFNRVQEEISRRASKKKIAEKLTKGEQGRYSAKFALTELLVCGECGTPYRRVTWTAKGYKEIKWRCISRLQYGTKYCHNSPTIDEKELQTAIVTAINGFCEVKGEITETLRESIQEVLDPSLNGSILAAQQRIAELTKSIDRQLALAVSPDVTEQSLAEIQKFSEEMTSLRNFIESEKAKQVTSEQKSEQLNNMLERLENEDFHLNEYDDTVARHLLECVKVIDKETVKVIFKGGFEIEQKL